MQNALDKPIVIFDQKLNRREHIRLTLQHFEGREVVDFRMWYSSEGCVFKPSPKGVTMSLARLPALAAAFAKAEAEARACGLLG